MSKFLSGFDAPEKLIILRNQIIKYFGYTDIVFNECRWDFTPLGSETHNFKLITSTRTIIITEIRDGVIEIRSDDIAQSSHEIVVNSSTFDVTIRSRGTLVLPSHLLETSLLKQVVDISRIITFPIEQYIEAHPLFHDFIKLIKEKTCTDNLEFSEPVYLPTYRLVRLVSTTDPTVSICVQYNIKVKTYTGIVYLGGKSGKLGNSIAIRFADDQISSYSVTFIVDRVCSVEEFVNDENCWYDPQPRIELLLRHS